jgi:uncharacterized protein YjbI with pentapeptide repeats
MAGLQAQASTANVAQAQKAEAFTPPSGRLQRQGFHLSQVQTGELIGIITQHQDALQVLIADEKKSLLQRLTWKILTNPIYWRLSRVIPQVDRESIVSLWKDQLDNLEIYLKDNDFTKISPNIDKQLFLSYLDLAGFDFNHAILQNVVFKGTNLREAIFTHADLRGVDLSTSHLKNASLVGCILNDTKLRAEQLRDIFCDDSIQDASIFTRQRR